MLYIPKIISCVVLLHHLFVLYLSNDCAFISGVTSWLKMLIKTCVLYFTVCLGVDTHWITALWRCVWGGGSKAEKTGSVHVTDRLQGPIRCYFQSALSNQSVTHSVRGGSKRDTMSFFHWLTGNKLLLAFQSLTLLLFVALRLFCSLSVSTLLLLEISFSIKCFLFHASWQKQ